MAVILKSKIDNLDRDELNRFLKSDGIRTSGFCANTKASESYVNVTFEFPNEHFETYVPYLYRRTNMNLTSNKEVAEYLKSIKPYFEETARNVWITKERKKWDDKFLDEPNEGKKVTYSFFKVLLSLKEEGDKSFPDNNNPQARFKDIKNMGYTVCIYSLGKRKWGKILLPLPLYSEMHYETFTVQFKARVIRLFNGINAYESKQTASAALIPDHKFSEIRWDENTKAENSMTMTDVEIVEKFQLLDNQRNQEKREVCRNCVQTGKRGKLFGIDFYEVGTDAWDNSIPEKGKDSEKGCIGCPWYDIEAWRKAINEKLKK